MGDNTAGGFCGGAACSDRLEEFSNEDTRLRAEIANLKSVVAEAAAEIVRLHAVIDGLDADDIDLCACHDCQCHTRPWR